MPKVSLPRYPDIEEGTLCQHENLDHIVWQSQYGPIFICQMTDSHLKNVAKLLHKALKHNNRLTTSAWGFISMLRGEMAQYYAEQEIMFLERDYETYKIVLDRIETIIKERGIS